ncbi:MAG: hypothetical protein WEA99_11285 [Brumimicrobium sp.]
MSSNRNISLIDILNSLITYWYVILISSLFFGACFFLYFNSRETTFKTSTVLFIDFEKKLITSFGEYKPRNINSRDYLSLLEDEKYVSQTIEEFNLDISVEDFQEEFNIIIPDYENSKSIKLELVLSDENIDEILSYHVNGFLDNLKEFHRKEAIDFFKSDFQSNIKLLSKDEKYLKKTLSVRDSVLRKMPPSNFSAFQVSKLEKQGFNVSINDFFSPEYKLIAEEVVNLGNSLIEIQSEKTKIKELYSEIVDFEKELSSQGNNDIELFNSQNYVSVFAGSDKVVNVSKSIIKYSVLGLFIGFMVALFIILLFVIKNNNKKAKD